MMKFPIKRCVFIAACLLLIGLTLSGCSAQVTECPESLQVVVNDKNSIPADEVWLQCGYQMLLGGNMESVRASRTNFFLQEAGLNAHSSVLRRIARMHGTPIEDYIG